MSALQRKTYIFNKYIITMQNREERIQKARNTEAHPSTTVSYFISVLRTSALLLQSSIIQIQYRSLQFPVFIRVLIQLHRIQTKFMIIKVKIKLFLCLA